MLSILIPIYNQYVLDLAQELSEQCLRQNIDFEILFFDDFSEQTFKLKNKYLENVEGVFYKELKNNVGRSKIRNLLAKQAKFDNLLFLDCDINICSKNFIKRYIKIANTNDVVIGGVAYSKLNDKKNHLRWKYGRSREQRSASERNKYPHKSFSACNLFIKKSIFNNIRFSETISKYGHEDTLFGIELKSKNINITHIDNPVHHKGLESTEIFLKKTEEGLENLFHLAKNYELKRQIKIYNYFLVWKKLKPFANPIYSIVKKCTRFLLTRGLHHLFIFDLYKLTFLLCYKD